MRIAFAMINCNRRDGSARAVNEVAERLARRGHDVHLFAREAEDLDLKVIRWHRVAGPGWPEAADFWSYFQQVNWRLRGHSFDIVHSIGCNTLRANVVTIQNIQPAKIEVMARLDVKEKVSLPRRFTRWLYLRITCRAESLLYTYKPDKPLMFLPVSRGVAAELRNHYDIGPSKVHIIPNAADTELFHPLSGAERSAWRVANGLGTDDIVCVFSGGEWARKGLDFAIRAIGMIARPDVKLFVAGDDPDRGSFHMLAAEAAPGRVVFGGFRKDIPATLAGGDIFLFPSHYEAFSLATIEAAACGLPILATRINGTEDLIIPGETGEFVERSPGDIVRVLTPLLESPDVRRTMGENARRHVERNYTWDRVTDLTEQAYAEAIKS